MFESVCVARCVRMCVSINISGGPHTEHQQNEDTLLFRVKKKERKKDEQEYLITEAFRKQEIEGGKEKSIHTQTHTIKKATAGYDNMNVNPVLCLLGTKELKMNLPRQ